MVDNTNNVKAFKPTSTKAYVMPPSNEVANGGVKLIDITHDGQTYQLWTKKVASYNGDDADNTNHVLLLHGGPGGNHQYFECFESFLPVNNISIYYYDQLDSGYSSRVAKDKQKQMWTVDNYVDHVEAVRLGLGLEKLTLLGYVIVIDRANVCF